MSRGLNQEQLEAFRVKYRKSVTVQSPKIESSRMPLRGRFADANRG